MAQKGAFADFIIQYLQENENQLEDLTDLEELESNEEFNKLLRRHSSTVSDKIMER
jgi:hypothetical protein